MDHFLSPQCLSVSFFVTTYLHFLASNSRIVTRAYFPIGYYLSYPKFGTLTTTCDLEGQTPGGRLSLGGVEGGSGGLALAGRHLEGRQEPPI